MSALHLLPVVVSIASMACGKTEAPAPAPAPAAPTATPAPAPAPAPAPTPAPSPPTESKTGLNDQLIKNIASGAQPIDDLIIDDLGVVVVTYDTGGGAERAKTTKKAGRLCGAALKKELPKLVSQMKARLDNPDLYDFSCDDGPPPSCDSSSAGEGVPTITWHFDMRDSGLVLRAVTSVENTLGEKAADEAKRLIDDALAKQDAAPCTK